MNTFKTIELICLIVLPCFCYEANPDSILMIFHEYIYQDTSFNRDRNTSDYVKFSDTYLDTCDECPGLDELWVIDSLEYKKIKPTVISVKFHVLGTLGDGRYEPDPKWLQFDFEFSRKNGKIKLISPYIKTMLFPSQALRYTKLHLHGWTAEQFKGIKFLPKP